MPNVRGLKPSRLYRERAVLLRHPPVAYEGDFEEVATSAPTREDILVTRTAVRWGEFDETAEAGIRSSDVCRIETRDELLATRSDTRNGALPRRADMIELAGRTWNVDEVKPTGAPWFNFVALLRVAPVERTR